MNIQKEAYNMKLAAPKLAATTIAERNKALSMIVDALERSKEDIIAANHEDVEAAKENGINDSVLKRLYFNDQKLSDAIAGIRQLIELPDPTGQILLKRELDEGLVLTRVSVPIGVIGVIFEARPDALVQIASLCIKSGNCAILKGGKETAKTNKVLFQIIHKSIVDAGLPKESLLQAEFHNEIDELLACDKDVDLLIPRGSNQFVRYIIEHTKIPVMGHSSGICHIYVDKAADFNAAIPTIIDAKIQYPAACNAVETILIKRECGNSFIHDLAAAFKDNGVQVRGTKEVHDILDGDIPVDIMGDDDFATEYNDLIISVKLVDNVQEAVEHINRFGSHHTDCIFTTDDETAEYFMQMVDSAGVYRNCSTRFADGFRYGFGAEVGISTGKIHARGPVGLEGLVTYKYKLIGNGHIVGDYTSGRRTFHHKDMEA